MSTLYPGAIDDTTTLPPPGPNTVTSAGSVTHAVLHDNEILALQALEAKVGIGASTSTTSTVLRASSNGTSTWGKVVLTSDITGTLPVTNGGTGVTSSTGSGANVLANSPALVTPTGIVKGDVGLGNVDNTSDATKNAASVVLTNKSMSGSANTFTNIPPSGIALTKATADANGWIKRDYGTWQTYERTVSVSSLSIGATSQVLVATHSMPVGITDSSFLRFQISWITGFQGRAMFGYDNNNTTPQTSLGLFGYNITGSSISVSGFVYIYGITV
jgi:hypothetical protein